MTAQKRHPRLFGHRLPPAYSPPPASVFCLYHVPEYLTWRRLAGRPRTTWIHQIPSDCGLSTTDACILTMDRFAWRAVASAKRRSGYCDE